MFFGSHMQDCTTHRQGAACIHPPMPYNKDLHIITQNSLLSLRIVTSITLATKHWIRWIKIAASMMLFISPRVPCTHSISNLARVNVETWMICASVAKSSSMAVRSKKRNFPLSWTKLKHYSRRRLVV